MVRVCSPQWNGLQEYGPLFHASHPSSTWLVHSLEDAISSLLRVVQAPLGLSLYSYVGAHCYQRLLSSQTSELISGIPICGRGTGGVVTHSNESSHRWWSRVERDRSRGRRCGGKFKRLIRSDENDPVCLVEARLSFAAHLRSYAPRF